MAEPFVFHFRRGADGQPEQMYLADIRAECGLCRHEHVQRYYHSTPLHSCTVRTLAELALGVAAKTSFECPNCGTQVGPEHALSTAFTWAFADDTGLIRAFMSDAKDATTLCWQFAAGRRLDPQELPGWAADPAVETHGELTDELVEDEFDRPLNPKSAIREVLSDWRDDPSGGAITTIGAVMLVAARTADEADELAAELEDLGIRVDLDDCIPVDLPTHRDPAQLAGRLDGWLPDGIDLGCVRMYVQAEPAFEAIERAFAVANLSAERDEHGFTEITTPRDAPYPRPIPIASVLRRAVYTGLTPGDAARLTAEEIVGTLLRVW